MSTSPVLCSDSVSTQGELWARPSPEGHWLMPCQGLWQRGRASAPGLFPGFRDISWPSQLTHHHHHQQQLPSQNP